MDRKPSGERRKKASYGLRALAASLPDANARAFRRQGLGTGALAREWRAIVGPGLADFCRPGRLNFPKIAERRNGTLTLRVVPAFATELQHLEPLMIERINSFFGYAAVARLRLQQTPLARPAPREIKTPRQLSGEEIQEMEHRLDKVADPDMRAALERLTRSHRGRTKP